MAGKVLEISYSAYSVYQTASGKFKICKKFRGLAVVHAW